VSSEVLWTHHNPVRIVSAAIDGLDPYISGQHILLVTSASFVRRGTVARIAQALHGRRLTVLDNIKANPDVQDLDAAVQQLRESNIESVVGLGGGSALDAAKVLATVLPSGSQPTLAQVFRGGEAAHWAPRLPLVAIPTTAGTGAEVTPFATAWDHQQHKKHSLAGHFMYPDVAFLDANLTLSLPPDATLFTGLDATSHALESLWNRNRSPVSAAFALRALAGIVDAFPIVLTRPDDLCARSLMQESAMLAGLAISQTRTAVAHGISYPLTSHLGVPHGLACSFTLPTLLAWNIEHLVADGFDEHLLKRVLAMLLDLHLGRRMRAFASPSNVQDLQHAMATKGRSENYLYQLPGGLASLLQKSLED
jgi:alcohol dehydrogenase